MKHLVFVVNPRSGIDRQKAIQQAIADTLDHSQYTYAIQHTAYARHGTEIAKQAAEMGAYAVVAVGGDGSVNDIAKGLLGTNTAIAIIPKGSGNGMARSLSIPLNERKALQVINIGNTVMMDVGHANDKTFISNAGVGFDTVISEAFALSKTRGFKAYSWLVAKHLWKYKSLNWNITANGKEFTEKAFMITVANGQQFGYNFKIAPEASWTDGLLDIVIVKDFPRLLGGILLIRAMFGNILKSPYVKHFRSEEVIISNPELKIFQTDGDAHFSENKIHFRVESAALKVIVP
ncbi:MAG TPA: diacylglycerol kinase family lipid kinase [Flavipsychrobacter sp.]|nr:diacylglycerol kinase family lipid kinase [Flavipsychrobacter sp.]